MSSEEYLEFVDVHELADEVALGNESDTLLGKELVMLASKGEKKE